MGEETAFQNGWISDFQKLVTLTLDRVILHTLMHHSSTSTYTPNFTEIEETFCGRADGRTDEHLRPTLLGRLRGVDLKRNDSFLWKPNFRSADTRKNFENRATLGKVKGRSILSTVISFWQAVANARFLCTITSTIIIIYYYYYIILPVGVSVTSNGKHNPCCEVLLTG